MLLIGVNRSSYTRRVAITLHAYGVPYQQRALSGFGNRDQVRTANPLGRIPALVLDNGETLIDSAAIIDHLDATYGGDNPLTPRESADCRTVLKVSALMMGACDKALQAAYERNHRPPEKVHQPWIDDCMAQVADRRALSRPRGAGHDKAYASVRRTLGRGPWRNAQSRAGRCGARAR